jgi:hypothetical protein
MYRDQERVGHFKSPEIEYPMICTGIRNGSHFISPELEYPMICTGIRKGKVILYLLNLNTQ